MTTPTKNVFLAVVFAITAGINVLGIALPRIDPRRANYRRFEKAYVIMFGMLDVMMLAFFSDHAGRREPK